MTKKTRGLRSSQHICIAGNGRSSTDTPEGQLGKTNSPRGGTLSTKAFHEGGDRIPFCRGLVVVVVNILFHIKKNTLMTGHCTA